MKHDDITKNFHGGADTSEQAFRATPHEIRTAIRTKVLEVIRKSGLNGLICDEVEQVMGLTHQTASARLTELKARDLVTDTGRRRQTRSGRAARVYVETRLLKEWQLTLDI